MLIAAFWAMFLLAAFAPLRWTVYLFFVSLAFGSFNTIPAAVTLTPYAACAPLLVLKIVLGGTDGRLLADGILNLRRLGLLSAFVVTALVVTATAPAIFSGVPTMGLNTGLVTPLSFSGGNITQPIYLAASFSIVAGIYLLMLDEARQALLGQGLIVGGATFALAGTMDFIFAGSNALAPLRTATYALLANDEVVGRHRVVGFNTEASAYGAATLALAAILLFARPARALAGGGWGRAEFPLALLLILFTILSTSSGAYAGLGVLLVLWAGDVLFRLCFSATAAEKKQSTRDLIAFGLLVAVMILVVLARPSVVEAVRQTVDGIVLQKKYSTSYVERSYWNQVSLEGLAGTFGYGVGVGSTRASSWPVALVSGSGVLGAGLMTAFIARCLLTPLPPGEVSLRRMGSGARLAWLVTAIPAAGAATSIDFGFGNAILFALMAATPALLAPPRWAADGHLGGQTVPTRPRQRALAGRRGPALRPLS